MAYQSAATKQALEAASGRRTQKARGVEALAAAGYKVPKFQVYGIEYFTAPQSEPVQYRVPSHVDTQGTVFYETMKAEQEQFCLPFVRKQPTELVDRFVRPCPTVPRHGFVDSRPIKTLEEAEQIINETLAAEPLAEIISMPFIDAAYSAIWTDGQLIMGDGNDGATSGHGSRVIPVLGSAIGNEVLAPASITDSPYVELLWTDSYGNYQTFYVQLRNGPKVPAVLDSHKKADAAEAGQADAVRITNVVKADGDLLLWETKAANFPKGTAVHHPGGSLASHYAVHAVLNGHPVITTFLPEVGQVLVPNTKQAEIDIDAVRSGFVYGCQCAMSHTIAVYAMLSACHNTAVWTGRADALLGFGLGAAYRLTLTAALGEYRHKPGSSRKASRSAVYDKVWDKMLHASTRTRYVKALDSFKNDKRWPSSYGGKQWFEATVHAGGILNALIDGDIKQALSVLNKLVNAAHNGGWLFDKFCTKDVMDATAANPCKTLLKSAPAFYKAILDVEQQREELAKWFFHRRHYELDEQDAKAARADELEEIEEESEECESCDCGCCNCETCNPDGGCLSDDPHCSMCNPDGCGNEECETCNPQVSSGPIVKAQAKPIYDDTGLLTHLHVQYKQQNNVGAKQYKSVTVEIPKYDAFELKADIADVALLLNSYNSSSSKAKYLPLYKYSGGWYVNNNGHLPIYKVNIPEQE